MRDIYNYIDQNRDRFLKELFVLLSQPSISASNVGVSECAELLRKQMEEVGISARILPTAGHPVVYGEINGQAQGRTILIYGHYDVQSPDPLDLWHSPPFEPQIREGRIFGRGAGDNKGQLFAHLKAAEAVKKVRGKLPVHVKFLFEGEEEVGSRNLRRFMEENRNLLAADACYCSDGGMLPNDRPKICFGVRGICYVEVRAKGANRDVHSGNLGAYVPHPAWRLIHFLATLGSPDGRIRIQGFSDDVVPPTDLEKAAVGRIPFDQNVLRDLGLPEGSAAQGTEILERSIFQPALNICGLASGSTAGMKTIVPHEASARIDMRLVVDQDPDDIFRKLVAHARTHGFHDLEIEKLGGFHPSRTRLDHPIGQAAARAARKGFGKDPLLQPCMGGSDPDYNFTRVLGIPRINVPYAPHDENNHAPNENMKVEGLFGGIRTTAAFLFEAAKLEASGIAGRKGEKSIESDPFKIVLT